MKYKKTFFDYPIYTHVLGVDKNGNTISKKAIAVNLEVWIEASLSERNNISYEVKSIFYDKKDVKPLLDAMGEVFKFDFHFKANQAATLAFQNDERYKEYLRQQEWLAENPEHYL